VEGSKAGWFIPHVDKRVGGRLNSVIPLNTCHPERFRDFVIKSYKSIYIYDYSYFYCYSCITDFGMFVCRMITPLHCHMEYEV